MEQTNKDKLKFKIARGINALSNETLEYRKEAIIELFRVFDTNTKIDEARYKKLLEDYDTLRSPLSGLLHWSMDLKGHEYWHTLHNKLCHQITI